MKNYNEMATDVLRRIGEHEKKQRNRRNTIKRIAIPTCCFCLIMLLGVGLWRNDMFKHPQTLIADNSGQASILNQSNPTTSNHTENKTTNSESTSNQNTDSEIVSNQNSVLPPEKESSTSNTSDNKEDTTTNDKPKDFLSSEITNYETALKYYPKLKNCTDHNFIGYKLQIAKPSNKVYGIVYVFENLEITVYNNENSSSKIFIDESYYTKQVIDGQTFWLDPQDNGSTSTLLYPQDEDIIFIATFTKDYDVSVVGNKICELTN